MKEKFTKLWAFLIKPNAVFGWFCYALFFVVAILVIVFACLGIESGFMVFIYSIMGISFFYCTYLFVRYDYKKLKNACKNFKQKISNKNKFLNRYFNDIYFRTMLATSFSLFLGVCFVGYNAFAGIYYHSVWNGSISVYYALLVIIKIVFLYGEYKITNDKHTQEYKDFERAKMFRIEGVFLILVNIALVAPVTILAMSKKEVNLPMWVAIADATYTFYKAISCIYSFIKTRKNNNLSVKGIKNLNLVGVIISILSLENTMIITFSPEISAGMRLLVVLSALVAVGLNMWIAILTFVQGRKQVNLHNIKANESIGEKQ